MKSLIKSLLKSVAFRVANYPRIKYFLLKVFKRFPRIKARLRRIAMGGHLPCSSRVMNIPNEFDHLTPRARRIHADLEAAIAQRQKGVR